MKQTPPETLTSLQDIVSGCTQLAEEMRKANQIEAALYLETAVICLMSEGTRSGDATSPQPAR